MVTTTTHCQNCIYRKEIESLALFLHGFNPQIQIRLENELSKHEDSRQTLDQAVKLADDIITNDANTLPQKIKIEDVGDTTDPDKETHPNIKVETKEAMKTDYNDDDEDEDEDYEPPYKDEDEEEDYEGDDVPSDQEEAPDNQPELKVEELGDGALSINGLTYQISSDKKYAEIDSDELDSIVDKISKTEMPKTYKKLNTKGDKVKVYPCPYCSVGLNGDSARSKHILLIHQNIRHYYCMVCHYGSSFKSGIIRHYESVHSGVKKYKCNSCPEEFVFRDSLARHKKKHEKPDVIKGPVRDGNSARGHGGKRSDLFGFGRTERRRGADAGRRISIHLEGTVQQISDQRSRLQNERSRQNHPRLQMSGMRGAI